MWPLMNKLNNIAKIFTKFASCLFLRFGVSLVADYADNNTMTARTPTINFNSLSQAFKQQSCKLRTYS